MPKVLLPTLREKNHYMAFEIISDQKLPEKKVMNALWNSVIKFLGEKEASETNFWVIEFDERTQKGILKFRRDKKKEVRAAIALLNSINGNRAIPNILGISGTIKKLRQKFL